MLLSNRNYIEIILKWYCHHYHRTLARPCPNKYQNFITNRVHLEVVSQKIRTLTLSKPFKVSQWIFPIPMILFEAFHLWSIGSMIISYSIPGPWLIVSGEFIRILTQSGDNFEATFTDSQSRSTSHNDALLKKCIINHQWQFSIKKEQQKCP